MDGLDVGERSDVAPEGGKVCGVRFDREHPRVGKHQRQRDAREAGIGAGIDNDLRPIARRAVAHERPALRAEVDGHRLPQQYSIEDGGIGRPRPDPKTPGRMRRRDLHGTRADRANDGEMEAPPHRESPSQAKTPAGTVQIAGCAVDGRHNRQPY